MSTTIEGTVQRSMMGTGTWSLVATDGQTYEIYKGSPKEILEDGQKVKVSGTIRQDVMTLAMIGPVLEITDFERLN